MISSPGEIRTHILIAELHGCKYASLLYYEVFWCTVNSTHNFAQILRDYPYTLRSQFYRRLCLLSYRGIEIRSAVLPAELLLRFSKNGS